MALKYHQATLDLLGIEPELPPRRLGVIQGRERLCGVRFPAAVKEWFAVEGVEALFHDNTNHDHLQKVGELGDPREAAQGYLRVARENQAVVAWYVRLEEGDDPPVYDNNDEWNEDLSETNWQLCWQSFTNFIFDMISSNHFGGWYSGMHLAAEDLMPDSEGFQLLRARFQQGPTTEVGNAKAYRFAGGSFRVRTNGVGFGVAVADLAG
jgi:hypothetical protein